MLVKFFGFILIAQSFLAYASPMPTVSVCSRTSVVRDVIVKKLGKACDQITERDLLSINGMAISGDQPDFITLDKNDLSGINNLKELWFIELNIKKIPNSFLNGISLHEVTFWHSKIEEMSDTFFKQNEFLESFACHTCTMPLWLRMFEGLAYLSNIDFSHGEIQAFPAGIFDGASGLKKLNIGGYDITNLPAGLFRGLFTLNELTISGCSQLETLPPDFGWDLTSLKMLNLNYNGFKTFPGHAFKGLNNLEEFNATDNPLTEIAESAFLGLTNLKNLVLARNKLVSLPQGLFRTNKSLTYVVLQSNSLLTLSQELFWDLPELRTLLLQYNKIAEVVPDTFITPRFSSIAEVNFRNNPLSQNSIQRLRNELGDRLIFY